MCRVKCDECHGNGSNAGVELELCLACQSGYEPCPLHKCRQCDGSGAVCPMCRGMRFVREREFDPRYGAGQIMRCPTCTEGNNVNRDREMAAVRKYLLRWRSQYDPERDPDEERRQQRDAYQAEWQSHAGSNRWARQRAKRVVDADPPMSEPTPIQQRKETDDDAD